MIWMKRNCSQISVSIIFRWIIFNTITLIIYKMISCSYGRVEELVFFAGLKEQYEIVVHHYIQVPYYHQYELMMKCFVLFSSTNWVKTILLEFFFYIRSRDF